MSICCCSRQRRQSVGLSAWPAPANVQPSALFARQSASTLEWGFRTVAVGRPPADRDVVWEPGGSPVLGTPTCRRRGRQTDRLDDRAAGSATPSRYVPTLPRRTAVRQLSNEARLENFDAAGQTTASTLWRMNTCPVRPPARCCRDAFGDDQCTGESLTDGLWRHRAPSFTSRFASIERQIAHRITSRQTEAVCSTSVEYCVEST